MRPLAIDPRGHALSNRVAQAARFQAPLDSVAPTAGGWVGSLDGPGGARIFRCRVHPCLGIRGGCASLASLRCRVVLSGRSDCRPGESRHRPGRIADGCRAVPAPRRRFLRAAVRAVSRARGSASQNSQNVDLRQAGFDGGLEARVLFPQRGSVRSDASSEEVPARAA